MELAFFLGKKWPAKIKSVKNSMFDFDTQDIFGNNQLEKTTGITPRILKIQDKEKTIKAMKKERLSDIFNSLPEVGESIHIINNGDFDFWTFVPKVIDLMGPIDEFFASTWTLNRVNCHDLLDLFDKGKIKKIGFLTGTYFKRRESAVYATLVEGLLERGQKYVALENHAKVLAMKNKNHAISIEGSANFTHNPRIEQYAISANPELFEFHKGWIMEILT